MLHSMVRECCWLLEDKTAQPIKQQIENRSYSCILSKKVTHSPDMPLWEEIQMKPPDILPLKILSVQVIFRLRSDYCTNVVYRRLSRYHTELWSPALLLWRCYISSNSQAGQWNMGTRCYGQLGTHYIKKRNFTSLRSVYGTLSVYRHNVSHHFHNSCLSQLS